MYRQAYKIVQVLINGLVQYLKQLSRAGAKEDKVCFLAANYFNFMSEQHDSGVCADQALSV